MNKILPEMPTLTGEFYAPVMPMWLANALRIFSLLFSLGVAWLGFHDWSSMPTFAKVIVCILAPAFFLISLSSKKGWATYALNPFFLADNAGMYFRHKDAFTTFIGNNNQEKKAKSKQWLFVNWTNIKNIRVARIITEDGNAKCAAFDINANEEEVKAFFIDDLADKKPIQTGMKAVCFYYQALPSPSKVVAQLQAMSKPNQRTYLREKYNRAR
jgi:hypothetical protein